MLDGVKPETDVIQVSIRTKQKVLLFVARNESMGNVSVNILYYIRFNTFLLHSMHICAMG